MIFLFVCINTRDVIYILIAGDQSNIQRVFKCDRLRIEEINFRKQKEKKTKNYEKNFYKRSFILINFIPWQNFLNVLSLLTGRPSDSSVDCWLNLELLNAPTFAFQKEYISENSRPLFVSDRVIATFEIHGTRELPLVTVSWRYWNEIFKIHCHFVDSWFDYFPPIFFFLFYSCR